MRALLPFWLRRHPSRAIALFMVASAGALIFSSFAQNKPAPTRATPRAIPMVMAAAHPIPSGTVLALQDILPRPASGTVPDGAYRSREAAVGRVTTRDYIQGELFQSNDLRDAASLGISARLAKGQRAFSIQVTDDEIVGGFLQSGDHVDVLAVIPGTVFPSKNAGDVPDRSKSVLLLQNVLILAVGGNLAATGGPQTSVRTISLALKPDEVSRLALAQRFGKVSLAIRQPGDEILAEMPAVTLDDIAPSSAVHAPLQAKKPQRLAGIPFLAGTRLTSAEWGAR